MLQTVGDNPERFAEKTVALEGLGDALYANNSFNEAIKTFEQLADIQEGVVKLRALRKAMFAAYYQGDFHKMEELTGKAEENATADRLESGRVLHQKARVFGMQGKPQDSLKLNKEALEVFEEEYALSDAAWSLFVVGAQDAQAGQRVEGISFALRSIVLYDELRDFRSQMEAYFYLGLCFNLRLLHNEARYAFMKITEIDDRLKMADYIQLIPAYTFWAIDLQFTRDFEGAVSKNLKALEYSERTSSNLYIGLVYECLVMEYAFTGDMARAEYYFDKLMSLPQDALSSGFSLTLLGLAKAIHNAVKNQFEESNRYFNEFFEFAKVAPTYPSMIFALKQSYAWCLSRQGRFEEAKAQIEQAQQLRDSELEKFTHVNVAASLMTLTRPSVGQTFSLRLDLVNVSRSPGLIVRVENLLVPELKIVDFPADCTMRDGFVEFKDNTIKPFEVKTIKLTVQATKPQVFNLNPAVTYADESAQTKTTGPRSFTITVQPIPDKAKVAGKTTTGFNQLDDLLLGGIPDGYAIALTSPALEERLRLVERFVEAGVKNGQVTFYLTDEPRKAKTLAKEFPSNMYLFVCNPRANLMVEDLPNVFKLKGVDNLTDIDIALTKASRQLDASWAEPKRACIEITSDVLLQHHAVTTRKWLSGLIQDLKSKGFTILAVVDSQIHSPEELEAVLGVFDGEIRLSEKMTTEGAQHTMKIKKLINQKYSDKEIILNKEALSD